MRNRGWNDTASNVTCRELGYQYATSTILSSVGTFGKGEGPVWISGLDCNGHEDSLWECSWPKVAGIYWDHDNDVGLVCGTMNEKGEWLVHNSVKYQISSCFPQSSLLTTFPKVETLGK